MKGLKENRKLKTMLGALLDKISHKDRVHLSIINFSSRNPIYAGFQDEKLVYPASIYKLYVAGALLQEVKSNRIKLEKKVVVKKINATDKKKEVSSDPRLLLKSGDRAPARYLLDLMITRSDNSAANCLIDLVTREKINKFIHKHGWKGSEVTRKFLPREFEDKKYKEAPMTLSNTRHIAEFLYLVEEGRLINSKLSKFLKELLGKQLDKSKIRKGLPKSANFFHKTGWFDFRKDKKLVGVCGDCGIVEDGKIKYVISCIVTLPEKKGSKVLNLIGKRTHLLMKDLAR